MAHVSHIERTGLHWSFWLIGGLSLVWHALGTFNFALQTQPEMMEGMPVWWHAVVATRPWWASLAMLVAVVGGVVASLLMLLRKPGVFALFCIAFVTMLISTGHASLVAMDPTINVNFRQIFEALISSIVVGAFLVFYSKWAQHKKWLP